MFICCCHPSKCISPEQRLFSVLSWKEFYLTAFKIIYIYNLMKLNQKEWGNKSKGHGFSKINLHVYSVTPESPFNVILHLEGHMAL